MPTNSAAQPRKAAHQHHVRCNLCATPQNCLIGRLPVEHRARLAPHIREVAFQKDDCLLTEGVVSNVIRIIKRGTAMTTRLGPDRQKHAIALLGRGSLMGKFGLFDQAPQLGVTSVSAGRLCELRIDDLQKIIPLGCTPVAVELIDGARALPEYTHPDRAIYIFGPEDGSLDADVRAWCEETIYIPTNGCMNLAATVNVVLYDRMAKGLNTRSGPKFR